MICTKCNQKLPDDSEFCQYCGAKLEIKNEAQKIEDWLDGRTPEEITADEALAFLMQVQAEHTVEAVQANSQLQPQNESDSDFGLVPEKPIYTHALKSVDGEKEYLNDLRTVNGDKITYKRQGSMSMPGIHGMIDIYDTFLPSGQHYKTIYINMYGAKKSTQAPDGFVLYSKNAKQAPVPVTNTAKQKRNKFCSRCGSLIDSDTKICTGCGKKYFKGIRINKTTAIIAVLSTLLVAVSSLCVLQYVNALKIKTDNQNFVDRLQDEITELRDEASALEEKIDTLDQQVKTKQSNITKLKNEVNDLKAEKTRNQSKLSFFDDFAEIVPSNGTNTYHKYGCNQMGDYDSFRIYNTASAKKNYYECPYCH